MVFRLAYHKVPNRQKLQTPLMWEEECYYHWMCLQDLLALAGSQCLCFGPIYEVFVCLWKFLSLLFRTVGPKMELKSIIWKEAFLLFLLITEYYKDLYYLLTYVCISLFSVSDFTMLTMYWVITTAIIRRLFPVVSFSFWPVFLFTQRRNIYKLAIIELCLPIPT